MKVRRRTTPKSAREEERPSSRREGGKERCELDPKRRLRTHEVILEIFMGVIESVVDESYMNSLT